MAKILLSVALALLITHQLIPHHHDEYAERVVHSPFEHDHDFAEHYVDHVFVDNSVQPVVKIFTHFTDCIVPSVVEAVLVAEYLSHKRSYENTRSPLIDYYRHFSLRAPPVI